MRWSQNLKAFLKEPLRAWTRTSPLLRELRYVALDTETTGFNLENDRILCLGALKIYRQQIRVDQSLEVFLRQEHYNSRATEVHGLLRNENREYLPEAEALERFREYVQEDVIIAHHAHFDLGMINNALKRNKLPKLKNPVLDTSQLYKRSLIRSPLLPKKDSYPLDELAEKFDISKKDRHTALGDAYITAIAFLKIMDRLEKQKGITRLKQLLS